VIEFTPGMQILYSPVNASFQKLAASVGVTGAFTNVDIDAAEAGHAVRLRGVVDAVLPDGQLRLLVLGHDDPIFTDAANVEPLDIVTRAADVLANPSLDEQIKNVETAMSEGPAQFSSRMTIMKRYRSRTKLGERCDVCKDRYQAGAVMYKPVKANGWRSDARICLECVVQDRAPRDDEPGTE